jgi:hypothetical protein
MKYGSSTDHLLFEISIYKELEPWLNHVLALGDSRIGDVTSQLRIVERSAKL